METSNTKIKFAIYIWQSIYVIKSQFSHYLGKDGLIHDDAVENCQWSNRGSAREFLETWNSLYNFHRIEKLVPKKLLFWAEIGDEE